MSINPKEYAFKGIEKEEGSAFLLMPFREDFDSVYGALIDVCMGLDINCERADSLSFQSMVMERILHGIVKSELIIADITNENKNVFYELGIAHTLRDPESVIIITQHTDNLAVDIQHWQVIPYSIKNITKLKVDLKKKISHCRQNVRKKEFIRDYLQINGISYSEAETFLSIAEKMSTRKSDLIYELLRDKSKGDEWNDYNTEGLPAYFRQLEDYQSGVIRRPTLIIKVGVLSSNIVLERHQDLTKKFMYDFSLSKVNIDKLEEYSFVVDLCIALIRKAKLKTISINWMIGYLSNYRMGKIDIARTKIETFLIETKDDDINGELVKMLASEKRAVRESAADICGQKKLYRSRDFVISALEVETCPHVARSCIAALARLNAKDGVPAIYQWMENNQDKWGDKAVSAALKNMAFASLKELDDEGVFLSKLERLKSI